MRDKQTNKQNDACFHENLRDMCNKQDPTEHCGIRCSRENRTDEKCTGSRETQRRVWRKRKKREERKRKQHRSFDAILCRGLWPNRKSQVIAGSKSRQIVSSRQKSTRGVMSEIGIAQIDVWFRRYVVARPSRYSCLCRVCLQLFFDRYKILS